MKKYVFIGVGGVVGVIALLYLLLLLFPNLK